jgi:hypothetical protein
VEAGAANHWVISPAGPGVMNGLLAERGHTANIRITFWIGAVRDAQPVINTAATSSASVAFLFIISFSSPSAGRTRPHGEYPYHLHC